MKTILFLLMLGSTLSYSSENKLVLKKTITAQDRAHLEAELKKCDSRADFYQGFGHYFKGAAIFTIWAMSTATEPYQCLAWLGSLPACLQLSWDGFDIAKENRKRAQEIKRTLAPDTKKKSAKKVRSRFYKFKS
ncbi:hypothetical protein Noda2021_09650 [Candidatus Dependentiae bacterium Noda2021]|nr:hypothetical protein Noda2021_09650 [Candidatus Dependentiae bacterium Noda2021]